MGCIVLVDEDPDRGLRVLEKVYNPFPALRTVLGSGMISASRMHRLSDLGCRQEPAFG